MIFLGIDSKGVGVSLVAAFATGAAFVQDIPATPNDWWKFGTGLAVAVSLQYMAWQRQQPHRKDTWTESQRAEKLNLPRE